jgi:hypothetical protein
MSSRPAAAWWWLEAQLEGGSGKGSRRPVKKMLSPAEWESASKVLVRCTRAARAGLAGGDAACGW